MGSVLCGEVTDKTDPSLPHLSRSGGACGFIRSCSSAPQLRGPVFQSFPGDHTRRQGWRGEGGGGGREREAAHHWRRWGNEVTESESECDAKEKFTKQLLFGSAGVTTEEETGLIGLLCYVSLLIKVKGVSWIFSPLHFFIRHLLLSSGGNVKRLEPVPTAYYLKSARCDPADVPPALILAAFTRKTTALFAFTAPRTLLVFSFLDATGTIVNYSRSKFLERRFSFSVLWR